MKKFLVVILEFIMGPFITSTYLDLFSQLFGFDIMADAFVGVNDDVLVDEGLPYGVQKYLSVGHETLLASLKYVIHLLLICTTGK